MTPILTNEFVLPADGWYQLAPIGEFPHAGAKVTQLVDAAACTAMANRFREDAARANFPGLLVDYDHFSMDTDKSSRAAGWIVNVEARSDGLWGRINWTRRGLEDVQGGDYRFLSPVWDRRDCEPAGDGRVRPLRISNAAVTNDPNLKGIAPLSHMAALLNRLAFDETLANRVIAALENAGTSEGAIKGWETRKRLGSLYDEAINSDTNVERVEAYSEVDADEAARTQRDTGLDITGFEHALSLYSIRKAHKSHGNTDREDARGQMPLTREDIEALPTWIKRPDKRTNAGKTKQGLDTIRSEHRQNGTTVVVEEIRAGKKQLVPKTMYKLKNRAGASDAPASEPSPSQTSETFPSSARSLEQDTHLVNTAPADSGRTQPGDAGGRRSAMDHKAELLALLGLPAEATDEQISTAAAAKKGELANGAAVAQERDQLKNRAEAAEAKLAEHERRALEAQVEADLEKFADRIANREQWKQALLANREQALQLLEATPPATQRLLNRREARTPDGAAAADAQALANRRREQDEVVGQVQKEFNCATRAQAWEIARNRKPELFG